MGGSVYRATKAGDQALVAAALLGPKSYPQTENVPSGWAKPHSYAASSKQHGSSLRRCPPCSDCLMLSPESGMTWPRVGPRVESGSRFASLLQNSRQGLKGRSPLVCVCDWETDRVQPDESLGISGPRPPLGLVFPVCGSIYDAGAPWILNMRNLKVTTLISW